MTTRQFLSLGTYYTTTLKPSVLTTDYDNPDANAPNTQQVFFYLINLFYFSHLFSLGKIYGVCVDEQSR